VEKLVEAEVDGVGFDYSRRLLSVANARSECFALNERKLVCE
jgi:hypothetical protein